MADYCDVRTQTVSAWEHGKRPQRRFFAKIAGFLELPNEVAVEALLDGNSADAAAVIVARQDPPRMTELQAEVLQAVTHQLKGSRTPRPDLVSLFQNLLASVGLPSSVLDDLGEADD